MRAASPGIAIGAGGGGGLGGGVSGTGDFAMEVCAVGVCASGSTGCDNCARSGCASVAWMIQSPCRGVGNGLDSASGSATPNTTTPDNAAGAIMTTPDIRSADLVARAARITPSRECLLQTKRLTSQKIGRG